MSWTLVSSLDHVCDDTRSEPERLPSLGKRDLEQVGRSFRRERCRSPFCFCTIGNGSVLRNDQQRTCFRHRPSCPRSTHELSVVWDDEERHGYTAFTRTHASGWGLTKGDLETRGHQ